MSDILIVTSRALCQEDFLTRLERLAEAGCGGIILREKDLSPAAYRALAVSAREICARHGVPCILHTFWQTALDLGGEALHMPLPLLRQMAPGDRERFAVLGASCHSPEDAREAQALGCTYLTAGHVFDTACKQGLPGRGLDFLRQVCRATDLPVYAIGGISPSNIAAVRRAGAAGACLMRPPMTTPDPVSLLTSLQPPSP